MPATPTIALTPDDTNGRISIAVTNSDTPGSGNNIYRSTPTEYDGAEIKIAESVAVDGTFVDANVASGVTYTYRAEAVDSGVGAFSLPASSSVTLNGARLHAVTRSATTNVSGTPIELTNLTSVEIASDRALSVYQHGGRTFGVAVDSAIVERSVVLVARILTVAQLTTLQTMFEAKLFICFRDQRGRKVFGTWSETTKAPQSTFTDYPIRIDEADYSEAIA